MGSSSQQRRRLLAGGGANNTYQFELLIILPRLPTRGGGRNLRVNRDDPRKDLGISGGSVTRMVWVNH